MIRPAEFGIIAFFVSTMATYFTAGCVFGDAFGSQPAGIAGGVVVGLALVFFYNFYWLDVWPLVLWVIVAPCVLVGVIVVPFVQGVLPSAWSIYVVAGLAVVPVLLTPMRPDLPARATKAERILAKLAGGALSTAELLKHLPALYGDADRHQRYAIRRRLLASRDGISSLISRYEATHDSGLKKQLLSLLAQLPDERATAFLANRAVDEPGEDQRRGS